jgi:hypothetical protein
MVRRLRVLGSVRRSKKIKLIGSKEGGSASRRRAVNCQSSKVNLLRVMQEWWVAMVASWDSIEEDPSSRRWVLIRLPQSMTAECHPSSQSKA